MVRRVTKTPSRGSKKQSLPVPPIGVIKSARRSSIKKTSKPGASRGAGTNVSLQQKSQLVDVRNENRDWQDDNNVEARIYDLLPHDQSEQRISESIFSTSMKSGRSETAPDGFDDSGYQRLNPDARHAPTPQEARNVMLANSRDAVRAAVFLKEARFSVEELIIAPNAGFMIIGWIDDVSHPIDCIRIVDPNWRIVIDATRIMRVRRMDVENVVGGQTAHAFGFVGFLSFNEGGDGAGSIQVELWQSGGYSAITQCTPVYVNDVVLRDTMLAYIARASFFGNSSIESTIYLERGVGMDLVQFNEAITRGIVTVPYVERFGPHDRTPSGTIVVCLYGKYEFFFLQNCLFADLPGIDEYEFIFISNSPEMAEALLREAHCANIIYGLTISVVILPGNAGFGAANNVAARFARSHRLLFVNPDVFPRDRDWAKKHTDLLRSAPAEQSRIFGVPLYYDDGSLMHGGIYFEVDVGLSLSGGRPSPIRICRTEHYGKGSPANLSRFNCMRPVPAVTGAFISIERTWFEHLGEFTENYIFGHYEDADLCLKSIEKGTAPWIHDIRLWHLESKGSARNASHEGGSIVNRWLFSRTWMQMLEKELIGPAPTHALMKPLSTAASSESHEEQPKPKPIRHRGAR